MRKLTAIVCCLFAGLIAHAQSHFSFPFSSRYDEDAALSVGISYSYINARYVPILANDWNQSDIVFQPGHLHNVEDLQSISSPGTHGVSVGIPVDFRINNNWYATFQPNFVFINHATIRFTSQPGFSTDQPGEPVHYDRKMRHVNTSLDGTNFNSFEFPIRLKYRSDEKYFLKRTNRYRGYITGGVKLTRWLGIHEEYSQLKNTGGATTPKSIALVAKPEFASWELGIGTEIFLPYFRVSPEIRFSQSMGSVLDKSGILNEDNLYMNKLDKALFRTVSFSLIFH